MQCTICRERQAIDHYIIIYSRKKGYDGISILWYSQADESILKKMKEYGILYLSTRTIGYDHIDVKAAEQLGIHVFHALYQPNNVADFAVMMMLVLIRKATECKPKIKSG